MNTRGTIYQTLCQKSGRRLLKNFIAVTITYHQIQSISLSALIQFIVRKPKPSQEYTATNCGINSGVSSKKHNKGILNKIRNPEAPMEFTTLLWMYAPWKMLERRDFSCLCVNCKGMNCNQQGKGGHYAHARAQAHAHPSKS